MSLKGKIEAIIYAAEDPVTLDQIAVLLKKDVLDDIAAAQKAAEQAAAAQEASAAPQDAVTSADETWGETTDSAAVPPAEAIEPTATASEEPSEARQHPERAPDAEQGQGASEEQTASATDEASVPPPVAVEPTATASEEPSKARQHPERAPEPVPSEPNAEAEPQTSTASEAAQEPQASEPANAEAQVTAPTGVAPKRKKATDPDLPRVKAHLRTVLAKMVATYESEDRGIEIRQIAGGYRMATKPEHHDVVRAFAKSLKPPIKLSLQALETLAIVAYKQPVTAPEISEIRGVDSGGVVATLLERKLITTAGRKQVIGRPIQYKTTKEFLLRFGLNDLGELPSMEEFEKLAQETTDLFSADVPAETGSAASETVPGEPGDEESMEAADRTPEDSPERSEDRPGDYSSGSDTAESVVRDQVEGEQPVQPEPEGVSIPGDARPDTEPQRTPQEPAERPDEGDYSSGADTSESIIREQVEDEPATSEPVDAEKPSSESLGS